MELGALCFHGVFEMKKWLLCLCILEVASAVELQPYDRHYLALISQNDAYFNPMIDEYYTAGHSVFYASSEGEYGGLNHFGFLDGLTSFSLGLSQIIYAPKNKFDLLPPSDDHPYAGFLNLSFFIHHRTQDMLESLGIAVGVSGALAFGREVQNGVHHALNVGLAQGWDTQIGNEITINIYYEWALKQWLYKKEKWGVDIVPRVELAFGNANIYSKFDMTLRFGYNLESSFLSQGILGENGALNGGRVYQDGIGVFGFVGIGAGYVVRKMALEGNLFGIDRYARNINLEPLIGNLIMGTSIVSGDFSWTYKMIYTSKEFAEQAGGHMIGSVSLAYSF